MREENNNVEVVEFNYKNFKSATKNYKHVFVKIAVNMRDFEEELPKEFTVFSLKFKSDWYISNYNQNVYKEAKKLIKKYDSEIVAVVVYGSNSSDQSVNMTFERILVAK